MALARRSGAAVVSVDSMQVYREMDIGTAKPTARERAEVPHFMIDLVTPETAFSVAEFQCEGVAVVDAQIEAGRRVIIVGGSGLHFRALVDPLEFPPTDHSVRQELEGAEPEALLAELLDADPDAGQVVALDNPRRVLRAVEILRLTGETATARASGPRAAAVRAYQSRLDVIAIGMDSGPELAGRIGRRFDGMLDRGLVAEVSHLADRLGPTARYAVGYKELLAHLREEISLRDARDAAIAATAALAKRQRTFFRRDPRIRWLPWHDDPAARTAAAADALGGGLWNL